jgi:AraC-like DNA-binding protein
VIWGRALGKSVCRKGEFVVIPPDTPHALISRGTLANLCLDVRRAPFREAIERLCAELGIDTADEIARAVDGVCAMGPGEFATLRRRILRAPHRNFDLARLSRMLGVSRYRLIRHFARESGLTPHRYVQQARVRKAKRLIAQMPAAHAALEAGFCDQSHLCREFKRQLAMTVEEYRKAVSGV